MNVFELSAIASPLAGAIAGGMSAKASGTGWMTLGICIGLAIGLILYFLALRFTDLMLRVPGITKTERLSPFAWLASLSAVLVPMFSPFAAWGLSAFIVGRLLHL